MLTVLPATISYGSLSAVIRGTPFTDGAIEVGANVVQFGFCFDGGRENIAVIEVRTAPIYYRLTGETPGSVDGHEGQVGDIIISGKSSQFRAVRQSSSNGLIFITCFREAD